MYFLKEVTLSKMDRHELKLMKKGHAKNISTIVYTWHRTCTGFARNLRGMALNYILQNSSSVIYHRRTATT